MQFNGVQIENTPNIIVITDSDQNQVVVNHPLTSVVEVNSPGPQGPKGESAPFVRIGTSNTWYTTSDIEITGSLIVSSSNTFKNIGTGIFSGSLLISGSALYNGFDILTTAISGGFVNTSSFNVFSSSYVADSASFNTRILINSSSITILSGSFLSLSSSYLIASASFDSRINLLSASFQNLSSSYIINSGSVSTRLSSLEQFSSSLDATFATDAQLNAATASLSSSIAVLSSSFLTTSASFNTRINDLSVSSSGISASLAGYVTTSSFNNFSSSYNTGSFTGSFTGTGTFSSLNTTTATITGNVTVLGTASINTLVVNQTQYTSGSNQLGDGPEDVQTLFGTVRIPTGSLTVTGSTIISSSASTQLQVGSNLLFVSSSGRVGIGTTTPTTTLNVNGTTLLQGGQTTVRGSGTTSTTTALRVENSNATASLTILDNGTSAFNTSHLYVSGSGLVGVGTTLPTAELHISGANADTLLRVSSATQTNVLLVSGSGFIGVNRVPGVALDVTGQIRSDGTMFNSTTSTQLISANSIAFLRFFSASVETARYDNTGWGFFNTTPTARVHISGANTDNLFRVSSPSATNALFVSGSGNVGIGTATPTTTLNVNGTTLLQGGQTTVRGSGTTSATTSLRVENSSATDRLTILDDGTSAFNTSHLYVSSSGRIGIGTTSPTQVLDVSGSIALAGNIVQQLTNLDIKLSGTQEGRALRFIASSAGARIQAIGPTTSNLSLSTTVASSEVTRMTILEGGNVGINETNPSARLEIRGSGATSATTALRVENSNQSASLAILDDGNVGIGTATPSTTLQVAGTSSLQNIVFDTNNIYDIGTITTRARNIWSNGNVVGSTGFFNSAVMYNSARIGGEHTATALLHISGSDSAQMMRINSPTNANILFVSGSGNVGIGTSNPLSLLHISASSGNEFLRITSGSQNILTVRSGSAVMFSGTGVTPTTGFDLDVQGTGTANNGSVRFAGNGSEWRFGSVSSVNRSSTGNQEMFNVTMTGTSPTFIQNPMSITFNANQNPTSGSGYTVLRLNATHATTAGTGSKLLQTWEFGGVAQSVMNTSGSLGLRTTSPSATLDVSGSGRFTNGLIVSSSITSSGPIVGLSSFTLSSNAAINGTVNIGSFSSATEKLKVRGIGTTSATTTLRIENANSSASLIITDDGSVNISGSLNVSGSITLNNTNIQTLSIAYAIALG